MGVKLELSKCFYYPIIWKFDDKGVPSLQSPSPDNDIQIISSETGETVTIASKPATSSHKTLGIMENPSGSYRDEYDKAFGGNIVSAISNSTGKKQNFFIRVFFSQV